MDGQLIFPPEAGITLDEAMRTREVRFRPGQRALMLLPDGGVKMGARELKARDIALILQSLSGCGLAARERELKQGFLPLPGGHRLGVCGRVNRTGLMEIGSLCLCVAQERKGVGQALFPRVRLGSTLIFGGPGTGKTTLLRDLIRLSSREGTQVGVADERGEIAACVAGVPQLDVGPCTDVMSDMPKAEAFAAMLRSMRPELLAADEIGGHREAMALMEAKKGGVRVIATLHAGNEDEMRARRGMAVLLREGAFDRFIRLTGPGKAEVIPGEKEP